ncbi:hypothetical protein [Actinomadura kijaniata]|uniref:hypothetical protein n=1 Tax=Actinomadura kijaniata TaxID=46161 RepID=UPI00083268E9|nr:hypothetical protein [Actinomadura kijaniata]
MDSGRSWDFDVETMGWELVWFGPDEWLAGSFPVTLEQLLQIRHLFDYGDDEWLGLGDYPIEPHHWPTLIKVLSCPAPEPQNFYFLCAFTAGS